MARRSTEWVDRALEEIQHEYEEKAHRTGVLPLIERAQVIWSRLGSEEHPSSEVSTAEAAQEGLSYWVGSLSSHWLEYTKAEGTLERFARAVQHRLREAGVFHEATRDISTAKEGVVELRQRVKDLEERVARLEGQVEIPFRPMEEDGDPLEILQTLRKELGAERFRWFSSSE